MTLSQAYQFPKTAMSIRGGKPDPLALYRQARVTMSEVEVPNSQAGSTRLDSSSAEGLAVISPMAGGKREFVSDLLWVSQEEKREKPFSSTEVQQTSIRCVTRIKP